MEITKLDTAPEIQDHEIVKILECGNITEMLYMEHFNRKQTVQKINKNEMMICSTGQVIKINHSNNRSECKSSLAKTFYKIRSIINTNVTDFEKIRWVTLTYAENMKDNKKLYTDMKSYSKRFKRYLESKNITVPEYITIAEPQGRGAWHCHIIYVWDQKAPFIAAADLSKLWGHGFVSIKKTTGDNFGAYVTAYLGDIPLDEGIELGLDPKDYEIKDVEYIDPDLNKQNKKILKGARIKLYPPGMNLLRCSKGIKRPAAEYMKYKKAKEKISSDKLTFSKTLKLTDQEKNYNSIIHQEFYNKNRK